MRRNRRTNFGDEIFSEMKDKRSFNTRIDKMEERVSDLEDKNFEITKSDKNKVCKLLGIIKQSHTYRNSQRTTKEKSY